MGTELTPEEIERSRKIRKWTVVGVILILIFRISLMYI